MVRAYTISILGAAVLLLHACGDLEMERLANCKVDYESPRGAWDGDPYELHPFIATVAYYRYEDGACPVAILRPREPIYASGALYSKEVFNQGGVNNTDRAVLQIQDANRFTIAEDVQPFIIQSVDEKRADLDVRYPAVNAHGTIGEKDLFSVRILDYCCMFPQLRAQLDLQIDYVSDAQFAKVTVVGDEIPLQGASQTWGALSRSAGRPHEYEWFRDGVRVGSGSTYTSGAGSSDFDLRVDMRDAYGRTATHTLRVDVDGVRASLAGPRIVYASQGGGTWTVSGRGGYPPYAYDWLVDGRWTARGPSWTGYPGEGMHRLEARMTDARGTAHVSSMQVEGIGSAEGGCQPVPPAATC